MMDDLLNKLDVLMTTVDILDDSNVEAAHSKLKELWTLIDEARNVLSLYSAELHESTRIIETQKELIQKLEIVDARIHYLKENFPKDVLKLPDKVKTEHHNNIFDNEEDDHQLLFHGSSVSQKSASFVKNGSISDKQNLQLCTTKESTPKYRSELEISISYISNNEFVEIPQYMKGRLRASDLNSFIDTYNNVLNKKYALLKKSRKSLKNKKDLDQILEWKSQENNDTAECYFCTAKDIDTHAGLKLGKKEFTIITILRHLKRIKEHRVNRLIYYVACF